MIFRFAASRRPLSRSHPVRILNALSVFTIFLMLRGAACMPVSRLDIPRNVTYIAHDVGKREYVALWADGSLYRRFSELEMRTLDELNQRDASSCSPLSSDDVKKLPGFSKLDAHVRDKYGKGKANIVTNPSEYPDKGAVACIDTGVIPIKIDGKPTCTSNKATVSGQLTGTGGTIRISFTQGYATTATIAVEKWSEVAVGVSFAATFGIPDIAEVGVETTVTGKFTNVNRDEVVTTVDNTVTQDMLMTIPKDKKCHGTVTTKRCNVGGRARARISGTGYIWYNFESRTAPAGSSDKHYKWAILIESVLTNQDDRSTWIDITSDMTSEMKSNYAGVCE